MPAKKRAVRRPPETVVEESAPVPVAAKPKPDPTKGKMASGTVVHGPADVIKKVTGK